MSEFLAALVGLAVGWLATVVIGKRSAGTPEPEPADPEPAPDPRQRLYAIAGELAGHYDRAANPEDLEDDPQSREAVELLAGEAFTAEDLFAYFSGDNPLIATLASMAMRSRRDDVDLLGQLTRSFNSVNFYAREFALRALEGRVEGPILGTVLECLDASWQQPWGRRALLGFARRRVAVGDVEVPDDVYRAMDAAKAEYLAGVLRDAGATAAADRLEELQNERIDTGLLNSIGTVWEYVDTSGIVRDATLERRVAELDRLLRGDPPRSIVLVGPRRVGKTTALRVLAERLLEERWTLFEAGAVELLAGQSYIGEIEQRMQSLLRNIGGKPRVVWIVPDLQEMQWAGRHKFSTTSLLDMVLPWVETGRVLLLGEIGPEAHERLLQGRPTLRTAMETVRFDPLGDAATVELAHSWAESLAPVDAPQVCPPGVVRESFQLAQQFLGDSAQPGNLLDLLELTRKTRCAGLETGAVQIRLSDVFDTLSRLTGLPRSILDDREGLDLSQLEQFFRQRVIGQPEAVSCLVERVAMIKAGLTDPTRPMGVFLFTGPTGTGKTEIAKTLAAFLFGSADRMVRLDMSEFQQWDSVDRLLGDRDEHSEREALVHQIRKQPFAVVLLDEIEKAHPTIWDLFLQVFDDGRLTDRLGRLADFRHTIVIMTSNLGADVLAGGGMGFRTAGGTITSDRGVEKALRSAFRPEFLNRIDRIVVFRSLTRSDMRRVLDKELRLVLERRGLRNRQWAVEWDESALEFFLDRGFTPELGARPLRRTIERHLLAPLAMTIVNQKAPTGDQFLFVRSDGQSIVVQFVDPDAIPGAAEADTAVVPGETPGVGAIAFEPSGTRQEVDALRARYEALRGEVSGPAWTARKWQALEAVGEPDFWSRDDRFGVLAVAEYMDRIEVGLETAGKLLGRLAGIGDARSRFPRDLVGRLAEQLHLVGAAVHGLDAGDPADAYLLLEPLFDSRSEADDVLAFARRLAAMYRAWAEKRRMELEVLDDRLTGGDDPRCVLACAGFGAWTLLSPESGLHVLVGQDARRNTLRHRVRVTVAPCPNEPAPEDPAARLKGVLQACRAVEGDPTRVVRRYSDEPSPLVRDAVRGWRTGRVDRVFAGDFDLLPADGAG